MLPGTTNNDDFKYDGCKLNVKCGQSHCKFQLTTYSFKNQAASATTQAVSATTQAVSATTQAVSATMYTQAASTTTTTESLQDDITSDTGHLLDN